MGGLKAQERINIFTDGSCPKAGGPGGWAFVFSWRTLYRERSGHIPAPCTNNRAELLAVIHALESLTRPCLAMVHTDSQYVLKGFTEWLQGWKRRGWRNYSGGEVSNRDLWERLEAAAAPHDLAWQWVKGHSGHVENERCDELAGIATRNPS